MTRRQWWFRTLLVSGLLAGVMGMHGLTTGHAATPVAGAAMSHAVMAPSTTGADGRATTHLPAGGHAPTGGHGMLPACLAILAAAVALLVLLLRRERAEQPLLRSGRSPLDVRAPRTVPRAHALTLHQLSICRT